VALRHSPPAAATRHRAFGCPGVSAKPRRRHPPSRSSAASGTARTRAALGTRICPGKPGAEAVILQKAEAPAKRLSANAGGYLRLPQRKKCKKYLFRLVARLEAPTGPWCDSGEVVQERCCSPSISTLFYVCNPIIFCWPSIFSADSV